MIEIVSKNKHKIFAVLAIIAMTVPMIFTVYQSIHYMNQPDPSEELITELTDDEPDMNMMYRDTVDE